MNRTSSKTEPSAPAVETIEQVWEAYYSVKKGLTTLKSILGGEPFFRALSHTTDEESTALRNLLGDEVTQKAIANIKMAYDAMAEIDLSRAWSKI